MSATANDPSPQRSLPRATELAHAWVVHSLPAGGTAIDATAGNGHDTEFLARKCGSDGAVHAFDIQSTAIANTRARLETAGHGNVTLHSCCHSRMAVELGGQFSGRVHAIMFNLGYLPGGDKSRITRRQSTLTAFEQALPLLAPGGIMTIVSYAGHPGGAEEAMAVEDFARQLSTTEWHVAQYRFLNQPIRPPELIGIVRRSACIPQKPGAKR